MYDYVEARLVPRGVRDIDDEEIDKSAFAEVLR